MVVQPKTGLLLLMSTWPAVQAAFFNHMVVQPETGLLLLANSLRNTVYVLRLDTSNPALRFAHLTEFAFSTPIISLTAHYEPAAAQQGEQVRLYTVQPAGIQQYELGPAAFRQDAAQAAASTTPEAASQGDSLVAGDDTQSGVAASAATQSSTRQEGAVSGLPGNGSHSAALPAADPWAETEPRLSRSASSLAAASAAAEITAAAVSAALRGEERPHAMSPAAPGRGSTPSSGLPPIRLARVCCPTQPRQQQACAEQSELPCWRLWMFTLHRQMQLHSLASNEVEIWCNLGMSSMAISAMLWLLRSACSRHSDYFLCTSLCSHRMTRSREYSRARFQKKS